MAVALHSCTSLLLCAHPVLFSNLGASAYQVAGGSWHDVLFCICADLSTNLVSTICNSKGSMYGNCTMYDNHGCQLLRLSRS